MTGRFVKYTSDPLYKNSFFIMLSSLASAGFGFFFWMFAAKLYSKEDVGLATAMISSIGLIVLLSRLGFDQSVIRFFPDGDKKRIFVTSVVVTNFFAILLAAIFLWGVELFSPRLSLLKEHIFIYFLFLLASSLLSLTGISFVALRRGELFFLQNLFVGSRVGLLFPLVSLGVWGIFGAVGFSFILALFPLFLISLKSSFKPSLSFDRGFLRESFNFSLGNYLAGIFMTAPGQILPVMALNILGANKAADYYIAFAIASLLFMIPNSVSTSLFVEGSHGEALKKTTMKSLAAVLSLLLPAAIIIYLWGGWLLKMIGKDYTSGFELLRIMTLSSFLVALNSIYFSIKRIQKDIKNLVYLSGLLFTLILGLGYIFMHRFGLIGIGYAWLTAYTISTIAVGKIAQKEKWI